MHEEIRRPKRRETSAEYMLQDDYLKKFEDSESKRYEARRKAREEDAKKEGSEEKALINEMKELFHLDFLEQRFRKISQRYQTIKKLKVWDRESTEKKAEEALGKAKILASLKVETENSIKKIEKNPKKINKAKMGAIQELAREIEKMSAANKEFSEEINKTSKQEAGRKQMHPDDFDHLLQYQGFRFRNSLSAMDYLLEQAEYLAEQAVKMGYEAKIKKEKD